MPDRFGLDKTALAKLDKLPAESTDQTIREAIADLATDKYTKIGQALDLGNKQFARINARLEALESGHTDIKTSQSDIKTDTQEILEFMRTAKMGARILSALGHSLIWGTKVLIAFLMLVGVFSWVKTGKPPSFLSSFTGD